MTDQPSGSLRELAEAYGIATEFWTFGGEHRTVPESTIVAILAAMGVQAGDDVTNEALLRAKDEEPWRHTLPHSVITRSGHAHRVPVYVVDGTSVRVFVELEDGLRIDAVQVDEWVAPREIDGAMIGRAVFALPETLPLGWHTIVAETESGTERAPLAVTPDCLDPRRADGARSWGMMVQLYSVRSKRSWGIGDARDLAEMCGVFGDLGADFVLINPINATAPALPITPSPYLPSTRQFFSPLYIRPEDIEEVAYLPGPQRALVEWAAEEVRPSNTQNEPIDRDAVWEAKSQALEVIYTHGRSRTREREFERFKEEHGQRLQDFALWSALVEKNGGPELPDELASSRTPYIARQRRDLEGRVEYHCWLQWILDLQLARAQAEARAAGMSIGVMQDLAVGVFPFNADKWSNPEAFADGVCVGAPPDMYNQQGQDWSQPPWRPDTLARTAYEPLREMARAVLRHAGALRVDHVMGLFRLWWIPEGSPPTDGAYVRYDHEAMIGVLLLEAHRAGAIVIGEDLGTVEPWVRGYLEDRGVLGTSVLWFEKDHSDYPLHAGDYRSMVLASVDTHDLPPAAGYLAGEHVELRARLGLLTEPEPTVRAAAHRERDRMIGRLTDYGLLSDDPTEREIIEALHRYVAMTPSLLVGVSLTDAVGERRAQNQPGTDQEYPNWKIPLADGSEKPVLVEHLISNARLLSLVGALRAQIGQEHERS